jgi:hypothetical protein
VDDSAFLHLESAESGGLNGVHRGQCRYVTLRFRDRAAKSTGASEAFTFCSTMLS